MNELTIAATVENIPVITEFVDKQMEALDCPMKAQMQIDIAIDELFSNIARYAYRPGVGPATVRVETLSDPVSVVITFIDNGIPYDPLAKADPDTTLSAEDREIGGLDGPLDALTLPCVGALILCSQDPARSIACYALHPVDFLPKPVGLAALERALQRCIPLWQDRLQWLELSAGRVQIPLCELMWAEASGHSLVLHCAHGVIRASESLSKLEAKLPPRLFLRCQRSFLVNLHHIQALEDGCFRMSGGDQVPIGRGGRGLAAQAYAAYRRLFQ